MRTLAAMPLLIFAPATNPTRYNRAGAKGEQDASTKLNVGWFIGLLQTVKLRWS